MRKPLNLQACLRLSALLLFSFSFIVSKAQVTELYTDFGGYWKSTVASPNSTLPNNSNNMLAFKYNGTTYSTGVADLTLFLNGVGYTAATFKALPFSSVGGTVTSTSATYIALGTMYDAVSGGYSQPLPALRILDVLTDGINGLDIGTGVTNVPATALFNYPVSNINTTAISDGKPDIIYTQTAQPTGAGDSLYFVNASGVVVGNRVFIQWTSVNPVGSYMCDLYSLNNTSCDAAIITGGNQMNQTKEIRLFGLQLSEFGLTAGNASTVKKLIIKPGGNSDPAFMGYNTDAFSVPSPVIIIQPNSRIVCPGSGLPTTFSVTASGSSLTYQWQKNGVNISGATAASYTINPVTAADAGMYNVVVSNASGSVTSSMCYLNTVVTSQPSPAAQTIATGNSVTLSISSTNATSFQWKKDGVNISGATSESYTINPVTTASAGSYTVVAVNSAGLGCANATSSASVLTPSVILYSKSSGNLNVAGNWGVAANGTGSTPINFTRSEHIFKVANRATAATGADLTIAGTFDLMDGATTITPATTLNAARIIRSGTGTLSGSSTANLTVNGVSEIAFTTGSSVLKNLTIAGGTTTLASALNITAGAAPGIVKVTAGSFVTNNNLTLKSDTSGTASVGTSAGTLTGNVTIERYMPARRAWRLMTSPIMSTGAPTINAAWQEGAASSASDPHPGFGTHITGGTSSNGFDQSPTNATSLKYFNGTTWVAVPNTMSAKVTDYTGYMFFVRGNRSTYQISPTLATTTPLVANIRVKGAINQGTQAAKTIAATGYTLVGNPYPSPIDFNAVIASSTNVKNRIRVWHPGLGGASGVGCYVLLDWNGSGYTSVPSTTLNGIIQAGQAFFVQSGNGTTTGSFVVNESHKSTSATNVSPFGRPASFDAMLAIDLKVVDNDTTKMIADGVLAKYNDTYSNDFNVDDAAKFGNNNENLWIIHPASSLALEERQLPQAGDSLKLKFTGIKNVNYEFEITPTDFSSIAAIPMLYDKYLNTMQPINTTAPTTYAFSVNADPLSKAAERFGIVYRSFGPLAVTFTNVKAYTTDNKTANIEWKVEGERNIERYDVQRQEAAGSFETIGTVAATQGTVYNFIDIAAQPGKNIYRVRSIDRSTIVKYSNVVMVNIAVKQPALSVFPNPVVGKKVTMRLQNMPTGLYTYSIVNNGGQVVSTGTINYNANQSLVDINLKNKLPEARYQLLLQKDEAVLTTPLIIKD